MTAKVLVQMGPLPTRMTTRSFDLLVRAIEMVRHDAPDVFAAVERANPYSAGVRRRFFALASALDAELAEPASRRQQGVSVPCYAGFGGVPRIRAPATAEHVIAVLRAREVELRTAGIRRLSLFGSVARGDADADSDVDLAAELDQAAHTDLFRMTELERRIADLLGRRVDLIPEPVEKRRLQANIERDRRLAF